MLFDIGNKIREARKNRKMTQEEIAEKLGMSRTTIGQIENGTVQEIGVRKLIRLLEFLGLELRVRPAGRPPTLEDLRKRRTADLGVSSLAVWTGGKRSGLLARERRSGVCVRLLPGSRADAQVSLTMPVRLESWVSRDLHPIFQMNLPEGALLEAIRRAIAKVIGEDDLSILRVTGGNQVGRNRFSLPGDESPHITETPESLTKSLPTPIRGTFSTSWWPSMPSDQGFQEFNQRSCWRPRSAAR